MTSSRIPAPDLPDQAETGPVDESSARFPLRTVTVVVPVDLSDESVAAIRVGLNCVAAPAGLYVVHVLPPLSDFWAAGLLEPLANGRTREDAARERIEELTGRAGALGAQAVVLEGDPGLEASGYADTVGAGLIVVPSHGYRGVERVLIGSTAERIVRHANCPVLVLRRRRGD